MLPKRLLLATPLLMLSKAALASPRVARVRFHLPGNDTPVASFRPSAPAIHVLAELASATSGMQVRLVWFAVNTEDTPPNTRIIEQTINVTDRRMDTLRGNLTLNGAPWPTGEYRVDFLMIDAPVTSGTFRVAA